MRFIPAVSPVQIQVPLPSAGEMLVISPVPDRVSHTGPLVKWLRHGPFTAVTWVRVPYGSPFIGKPARACQYGGLAQLVRAPASHAGGHWFESSSLHQRERHSLWNGVLFLCCDAGWQMGSSAAHHRAAGIGNKNACDREKRVQKYLPIMKNPNVVRSNDVRISCLVVGISRAVRLSAAWKC